MDISTKQLRKALENNSDEFPEEIICALRNLLSTGLSCVQITSHLIVIQGMVELSDKYEEGQLLGEAVEMLRIMRCLKTLNNNQDFCVTEENESEA